MNKTTDLELFVREKIVISDDKFGMYIPIIKSYLSKTSIKMIEYFIKEQEQKGVNFSIDDKHKIDVVGMFEISKLMHDYYQQNEQVPRSDIKKLKNAIKMCAKYVKRFDINHEFIFDKLLIIDDKKYFTEEDLREYRLFFYEPFVQSLKKQSSKYPVLLFFEVMNSLDSLNKKNYKTKETKTSKQLKKLILNVFELETKTLRVEDKKEYEKDVKNYRNIMSLYFEIVRRHRKNDHLTKEKLPISIENFEAICFTAQMPMPYDRLCNKEEIYLKRRSLIKQLEQYKILTTDKREEAKKVIAEIEAECLEMIERQPFLHGFNTEDEELFYSVVKQIKNMNE